MQVNIEKKDKPGKWITLHSLMVLKGYYSHEKSNFVQNY